MSATWEPSPATLRRSASAARTQGARAEHYRLSVLAFILGGARRLEEPGRCPRGYRDACSPHRCGCLA